MIHQQVKGSALRRSVLTVAVLVVALAALASPLVTHAGGACGLRGDANCDGQVNSIDATFVLQDVAGLIDGVPAPFAADVNFNDVVDAVDAALILQFDAGLFKCFGPCY